MLKAAAKRHCCGLRCTAADGRAAVTAVDRNCSRRQGSRNGRPKTLLNFICLYLPTSVGDIKNLFGKRACLSAGVFFIFVLFRRALCIFFRRFSSRRFSVDAFSGLILFWGRGGAKKVLIKFFSVENHFEE